MTRTNPITVRSIETGEILRTEGRIAVPPLTAKVVWARDGLCCRYCGFQSERDPSRFQLDHVHPVSRGGTNDVENLVVACERCNRMKGAETGWKPLPVSVAKARRESRLWRPPLHVQPEGGSPGVKRARKRRGGPIKRR